MRISNQVGIAMPPFAASSTAQAAEQAPIQRWTEMPRWSRRYRASAAAFREALMRHHRGVVEDDGLSDLPDELAEALVAFSVVGRWQTLALEQRTQALTWATEEETRRIQRS